MRRINVKFAAGLFLVLVVAAAGAYGLYVFQASRIANSLLWQAHKHREEAQPEKAIKLASQYLQFRPDDTAVMTELSEWLRERAGGRKQLAGVAGLYERILRVNADDEEIRRKAVAAYFSLGYYREAFDHIERLLPAHGNDAELLTQAGYCLQSAGKYQQAADCYSRAIAANARYVPAYGYAAALQQSQFKNAERATEFYVQAVTTNPESTEARAALAAHYRRQRRFEDAAREIEQGLARSPNDATLLLTAADIAAASGDLRKSVAFLDRGCEYHPTDTRFVCSLSWQLLYDGRADLAVQKLRAGKALNPNDIDILTLLGDILAQDGQIAPLEQTLRDLQEAQAPAERVQPRIQYVEARLLMRRGRIAEAAQKLDGLRALGLRMPSLYRQVNALLAQCAEQLGDSAGELEAIKRLLDNDPTAGAMRLEYSRALARAGKPPEALREFLAVLPRPQVSSRLVADAARTLIACAHKDTSAWSALERAIESLKLDDANPNPTIARAELERTRNRPDVILGQIVRNIGQQPGNVALHAARAALFELKFGPDRALTALNEAEKLVGDHAEIRLARARLLAVRLDRGNLDGLIALGAGIEKFTAEDRLQLLREIAGGCRLLGDSQSAAMVLERIAESRPDDFTAREALFSIALRRKDTALMTRVLAGIDSLEGKNGPCRSRLEVQRVIWETASGESTDLAAASARLDAVAKARPADPVVPFLRGRIAELQGHGDEARIQYRTAFDRGFLERPVEELLFDIPGQTGRSPSAVIRDELAARIDLDTSKSVVFAALPLLDGATADRLAARLTQGCQPGDGRKQAWLGRVLARMGQAQKADEAFRRAAVATSQSHEGWLALIADRLRQGDANRLAATLAEVRQALPAIEAELLIGRAFESAKRYDDARRAYEGAAALRPDDPRALRPLAAINMLTGQPAAARSALEALSRLPETSHPDDVRWARRSLALQCAFTPSLADFQRGMNLLEANKIGDGWTEEDTRARALLLATQKGRSIPSRPFTARQESIQLLEALLKRGSTRAADDLILLTKLYRAEQKTDLALQARERLRSEFGGQYAAVAFLAREALRESKLPECEQLLTTLNKLGTSDFETLSIEFQYRVRAGDADRAAAMLKAYVASSSGDRERIERSLRSGSLTYEFLQAFPLNNRPDTAAALRSLAIEMFRISGQKDSEVLQRMVVLLANSNQVGPAFDLVQDARAKLPADAVASAQVLILRNAKVTEQHIIATERFLKEQVEKSRSATALVLCLADFYQCTGKQEQAVNAYLSVLQREPDNVTALNNLAWTLSSVPAQAKQALGYVQRAIDLLGPSDDLLDTRARILAEAGDVQAGLRDQIEVVNESPSASRYNDLAMMHRKAGQPELADRAFSKAREYGFGDGSPDSR